MNFFESKKLLNQFTIIEVQLLKFRNNKKILIKSISEAINSIFLGILRKCNKDNQKYLK